MDNNESIKPQQTGGLKLMTVFIAVLALHVLVIGGFTVYHLMGSGGTDADLTLDKTHKLKADGTVATDTATPDATAPDKTADVTASTDTATTPSTTGTATATTATATPASSTTETATPASTPAPIQVAATTPAAPAPVETNPATPASGSAPSPIVINSDDMSQTSTIPEGLAPPPEPALAPKAPVPTSTVIASIQKPAAPAAPTPRLVPSFTPAPVLAPTPAVSTLSSSAPSGPVMPESHAAMGPVHMPANPPAPEAPATLAQGEEHVSAPMHEEHTAPVAHEAKKEFYTVKITDSYKKIALAHHITVAELKEANHVKGNTLHAGEKLIIPRSETSIAKSEKTHESTVSETASTASLSASPASSAKTHRHYYTVAKGDTLKYIAKKFDVTTSALKEANDLSSAKLVAGEKLRIPSHEARNTASASTSAPVLTDRVAPAIAPQPAPAVIQPSQVETQPAPVEQPTSTPVAEPVPQPTPPSSPELTSLNF